MTRYHGLGFSYHCLLLVSRHTISTALGGGRVDDAQHWRTTHTHTYTTRQPHENNCETACEIVK